jgi:hypothetical protein
MGKNIGLEIINDRIIKIDNAVNDFHIEKINREVIENKNRITLTNIDNSTGMMFRGYIHDWYSNENWHTSYILDIVNKLLFSKVMLETFDRLPDLAFRLVRKSNKHEVQFSSYVNMNSYDWHTDDSGKTIQSWSNRILNYILYISNNASFSGGNLEICTEPIPLETDGKPTVEPKADIVIEPRKGTLVIFPSYILHKVSGVFDCKSENYLDGRMTINGHVCII